MQRGAFPSPSRMRAAESSVYGAGGPAAGCGLLVERIDLVEVGKQVVERDDLAVPHNEPLQPILVDRRARPGGLEMEVAQHRVGTGLRQLERTAFKVPPLTSKAVCP